MIIHLIEERDMDNVITMCKQLACLGGEPVNLGRWHKEALAYLPTQIMEALGIRWAEGPEMDWSPYVDQERLEYQLSFGVYRRRAFKLPPPEAPRD